MAVIDSHIHIDAYSMYDQEKIIKSLEAYAILGLISVSNDLRVLKQLVRLAEKYPVIKPCAGYHPEQELPTQEELKDLIAYIRDHQSSIYAIGEVGLPYYLTENTPNFDQKPYIEILEEFIILAKELEKPLNLHAVYEDTPLVCELLAKHDYHKAHFHWAKTDLKTLTLMKEKRYLISITPDIFYKVRTRELVKYYPLELLMVETDGPWKYRELNDTMTHPKILYDIVEEIASIKDMFKTDVEKQILKNTIDFYKI